MLHLHSGLRWIVLLLAVAAIVNAYMGMTKGNRMAELKKLGLFFMISFDIQVLLGLYLYFMDSGIVKTAQKSGEMMKNTVYRFWGIEHIFGMLLALILVHIGYRAIKNGKDEKTTYKKIFRYFLIAFIIVFLTIPWPFRELIARPLF